MLVSCGMTTGVTSNNTRSPTCHRQARCRVNGTHVVIMRTHCPCSGDLPTSGSREVKSVEFGDVPYTHLIRTVAQPDSR